MESASKPEIVRLGVNLPPGVAQTLKQLAEARGATVTEEIRRAIALDKLISEAMQNGHKVCVVEGHGPGAVFRDVMFL